ncbi:putative haloalkanoic acid dehalogenase [Rhizoctonia solani]|nr:putative haloalkanoic acid dehalogenase [Rhizoctonia solani]
MSNIQNPENKKLSDFKVLNFDVFGTLIDWESGVVDGLEPLLARSNEASKWTRKEKLDAFEEVEAGLQRQNPDMIYSDILANTHNGLAAKLGIETTPELDKAFGQSIRNWTPFPDTCAALAKLSKYYKLAVLSNVDNETFQYTIKRLESEGGKFSQVVTAQDVGSYKPDERNFLHALREIKNSFGVEKEEVLVTAQSLFHDHAPANKLGLKSAWIARENVTIGRNSPASYTFKFITLGVMADAAEAEFEK